MTKSIKFNQLKFICNCRIIPPKGYSAITLFGNVYTRKDEDTVKRYLETKRGKIWYHHEYMHVMQKKSIGSWIIFYILYLWYFFKAWPLFMNWRQAYRTIPFELEAYTVEDNFDIIESCWRYYIRTNKERKTLKV